MAPWSVNSPRSGANRASRSRLRTKHRVIAILFARPNFRSVGGECHTQGGGLLLAGRQHSHQAPLPDGKWAHADSVTDDLTPQEPSSPVTFSSSQQGRLGRLLGYDHGECETAARSMLASKWAAAGLPPVAGIRTGSADLSVLSTFSALRVYRPRRCRSWRN
jgi:hypothetical protein